MQAFEIFLAYGLNNWLWRVIPFLLIGAGLYFGVRTAVVQLRYIPDMFRAVTEKPAGGENISAFKAFSISAASPWPSPSVARARCSGCR